MVRPRVLTGDLIKALIGDADCLARLVAIVEDIVNGDLGERSRLLLLSLIASEKTSGGLGLLLLVMFFIAWPATMFFT